MSIYTNKLSFQEFNRWELCGRSFRMVDNG